MAEGNSPKGSAGVFAKKVQRQLSRGKEKVSSHSASPPMSKYKENMIPQLFRVALTCVFVLQVLQKLGKTVETRDEQFDHCLHNFNDQQVVSLIVLLKCKKKKKK